jgi:hypothetical protein
MIEHDEYKMNNENDLCSINSDFNISFTLKLTQNGLGEISWDSYHPIARIRAFEM